MHYDMPGNWFMGIYVSPVLGHGYEAELVISPIVYNHAFPPHPHNGRKCLGTTPADAATKVFEWMIWSGIEIQNLKVEIKSR